MQVGVGGFLSFQSKPHVALRHMVKYRSTVKNHLLASAATKPESDIFEHSLS
jgi:hypothetical protein